MQPIDRPDDRTMRDLGIIVFLATRLEHLMAALYCMVLDEGEERFRDYLSSPGKLDGAASRSVARLRHSAIMGLADEIEEWHSRCSAARRNRHAMVHSLPYRSPVHGDFVRWWHPRSGGSVKFDGVSAIFMMGDLIESYEVGTSPEGPGPDRVCGCQYRSEETHPS